MADTVNQSQLLHPEVVLYIIRHGHAEKAENDFDRILSEQGVKQAQQFGKTIAAAGLTFDQVICSSAGRAQNTGRVAAGYLASADTIPSWYSGKGWELYSPASTADNAAMWAATNAVEQWAKEKKIASAMSYAAFKLADTTGFLRRFMEETRHIIGLMQVNQAKRIALFNHAVIGNAVAEALFPQHRRALEEIELAPCDCIRLTATTCQYIPLMT